MKASIPSLFALLSLSFLVLPVKAQDEVATAVEQLKSGAEKIASDEKAALAPAATKCLAELAKIRDAAQSKGSLDGVNDAEATMRAVEQGVPAPKPKLVDPALPALIANYEKSRVLVARQFDAVRDRASAEFHQRMAETELRMTRAGNLEAARKSREARANMPVGFTADILPMMVGPKQEKDGWILVNDKEGIKTTSQFSPPIEITYILKSDGEVRMGYGATNIIFYWEDRRSELRIDGGPADAQHRKNAGNLTLNRLMSIKQVVLPNSMSLAIDGRERAAWNANFSGISEEIWIWPRKSTLSLKQILVKKLP